jgi:hypothetical protein
MDDLRRILGQWCFMDQYGSTLLKVLEDASRKHKSSSNKARVKERRNPNQPIEPTLVTANPKSSRKRRKALGELSGTKKKPIKHSHHSLLKCILMGIKDTVTIRL